MLKKFVQLVGGDPNQREIDKLSELVDQVNALENEYEKLSGEQLSAKTAEFRERLASGETLDDLLPEAFAAVREASKRTIGLRHYDVQLIGGAILHSGKIVEMKTGEGKTLVATLPLYLNALTGLGTHLITVNDYLARRDARWMAPIYNLLGLKVGVLQMAARTENGKKAFIVDLERESPHEDQHQLLMVPRKEAYLADITYGTNSEFGFDYLRDNMAMRWENRVQRKHHYAIIDEVDNVLIDEARTPLIISGPAQDQAEMYIQMAQIVKSLSPADYEVNEKNNTITLTEIGEAHVEQLLGKPLGDPDRPEDITPEQARTLGYLEQALRAEHLFHRNKEYLVQAGKVVIVDEFTGRLMPGRRWSDGLHQAVEAKEGVKVQSESVTYATITIQNYFRMYDKLAGMTGTAVTEAEEFSTIYKLDVLALPTNLEYQASRAETELVSLEARDDSGYKFTFYTNQDDPDREPLFWKRKDYPDVVYRTLEAKLRAIAIEVLRYQIRGRPVLLGTTSVELSEVISRRLKTESIRRIAQVMLLRDGWLEANDRVEDGRLIEDLVFLNQPLDDLNTAELRTLARDLEMSFNPESDENLDRLLGLLRLQEEHRPRLVSALQRGIPHQVLNARKHTEESQIIAGAGAFGAVTIATNMAGRGVDIKLGGELVEEIMSPVNRVLKRSGYDDAFEMTLDEKFQALSAIDRDDYGIYGSEIDYFNTHIREMESVRKLGGLHVIGSERHEARRIDNQLRGRSSRQGDPGSSRFYLSMEDELMRLFGGGQADSLMQRMRIDDAVPMEAGLVSRIVEQAQTRVEGANFDVRKHLLEYDDVLNTQRQKIYEQRDRIFTKQDLSEDVSEMLEIEINQRVPVALEDTETWKLLAWLNQIQPPILLPDQIYPSYELKLLVEGAVGSDQFPLDKESALDALLRIAEQSIAAEKEHLIMAAENLIEETEIALDQAITERMDALDTFIEGLYLEEEDEGTTVSPKDMVTDLSNLVGTPIRLSASQQRDMVEDPDSIVEDVRSQIELALYNRYLNRLVGAVERRINETVSIDTQEINSGSWSEITSQIIASIEGIYKSRRERYVGRGSAAEASGEEGQISREIEDILADVKGQIGIQQFYQLLLRMPQGTQATFDKKTHRRVMLKKTRLNYLYFASGLVDLSDPEQLTAGILSHLQGALATLQSTWGIIEFTQRTSLSVRDLDEPLKTALQAEFSAETAGEKETTRIVDLPGPVRQFLVEEFGRRALTEIYRQLLLSVITELWVDYLTQMEGLRVSVGLEAYAQRDPLVQYKKRAFELYQELLSNVRMSVVTRMFKYRPQAASQPVEQPTRKEVQQEVQPEKEEPVEERAPEPERVRQPAGAEKPRKSLSTSQKRRRKRRKRK